MTEYQIALSIGAACTSLVLLAIFVSAIAQRVYGFINDSEKSDYNFIMKTICKLFGLKPSTNRSWESEAYKGEGWITKSDGDSPLIISLLSAGFLPLGLLIAFKIYAFTLAVLLFIAIMFLARIVVRGKKLFNTHIKDKKAHQE